MLEFKFIYGENGYKIAEDMRQKVFRDELGMAEIRDEIEEFSYHFVGNSGTAARNVNNAPAGKAKLLHNMLHHLIIVMGINP